MTITPSYDAAGGSLDICEYPARQGARFARYAAAALRTETVGGIIMLVATVAALIWANTPWHNSYETLRTTKVGPDVLHLRLSLAHWAADGLLALFFFVAGLEVKEELTHGELRKLRDAALPISAAIGGVITPVLIYVVVSWNVPGAGVGWAIPTATDIAFALAVLAITASALPDALRTFLLTLAVVDDLIAITIIALFYSETFHPWPFCGAIVCLAGYWLLQRSGVRGAWLYIPIGVATWVLVNASGVHATVAGVALGLLTSADSPGEDRASPVQRADHYFRPWVAGLAVPAFAFLAAGVTLRASTLTGVFTDRVALGVLAGLLAGKLAGVFGGAWASVRLGLARISPELTWPVMAGASLLAGIGFTVSLLIGELAYSEPERSDRVTTAILIASVVASLAGAFVLHRIGRRLAHGRGSVTRPRRRC
jgi:Na+:H+ antiporter, NhaA family